MIEFAFLIAGLALLAMARFLPRYRPGSGNTMSIGWKHWLGGRNRRLRLDLPQSVSFMWRCSIEEAKTPLVLNDRVEITLVATPMVGDRSQADIELSLSSTNQLRELVVQAVAPAFDVQLLGAPLQLALTETSRATYFLVPKQIGKQQIRFEFWYADKLQGRSEKTISIKSRQFGVTLPAWLVMVLTVLGVLCSGAGVVLGFAKMLHK